MNAAGGSAPLFILSFRQRDELSRLAERAGWRVTAARRSLRAEARFLGSGADIAVVDARGALEEGQAAARALADTVESNAAALLVLLSKADAGALDRFHEDGATHFLISPFTDQQFLHALRFAHRHAARVAGSGRSAPERDASWRWQPGSGTVELSPALARKAGLGISDGRRISLMELFRKLDPEGRRAARTAIDRLIDSGEATAFAHGDSEGDRQRLAHHVRLVGDDGAVEGRTEILSGEDTGGQPFGRDSMTGVRDARAARAWLAAQLRLREGSPVPGPIAILLAVSRFDTINAAFGRRTGDAVLQAAARRIERVIGADEQTRFVARLAGAEFAILLAPPATLRDAHFLAGQLVEAIARPFMSGDHVVSLGCRAGVAAAMAEDDPARLLRRASAALAEAKSGDTGLVHVLDEAGGDASARAERLEIDLRRALDQDEIEIRFQPQVSVTSGRIVGAEALARWRHPEYGELGADTLFRVAERSDYLLILSDHVQRKAVRAAAEWAAGMGALRLSVNITAADMVRPGFAQLFLDLVDESGFPRERLTVEVTESGLIEDLGAAANLLAELRRGGVRIAIDDFGTGYSSLAYLKALPLDYLKLDKKLCEDITGSVRDRIVVRGVIDMARSLGLGVIAEGVESEEQLGLLAQEGCTLYQGFLCAPPVDAEALAALMAGQGAS